MKISSWNVNSVRARIIIIIDYLKFSNPDILMIQEIKTEEKNFPFNDFKSSGYESHVFGQKSYNGVALLSKVNIDKINIQFIKVFFIFLINELYQSFLYSYFSVSIGLPFGA